MIAQSNVALLGIAFALLALHHVVTSRVAPLIAAWFRRLDARRVTH